MDRNPPTVSQSKYSLSCFHKYSDSLEKDNRLSRVNTLFIKFHNHAGPDSLWIWPPKEQRVKEGTERPNRRADVPKSLCCVCSNMAWSQLVVFLNSPFWFSFVCLFSLPRESASHILTSQNWGSRTGGAHCPPANFRIIISVIRNCQSNRGGRRSSAGLCLRVLWWPSWGFCNRLPKKSLSLWVSPVNSWTLCYFEERQMAIQICSRII